MSETNKEIDSAEEWLLSRIHHSAHNPNFGFIETLYETCSASLTHLWKSNFRFMSRGLQKTTLKKDVARLRVWDETYPRGSLDTILRESADLRVSVVESLKGIGIILLCFLSDGEISTAKPQEEVVGYREIARNLEAQLERAAILISSEDSSGSSTDLTSDDSSSETQREGNRFGRLNCYIRCLMDMIPVIENHVHRSENNIEIEGQSQPTQESFRLSQNAQPFAMRIRDRFAHAPVYLVERLAKANWHRHVRIRAQTSSTQNESQPISLKLGSLFHDSALGSSMQYATTVASHTSFISQLAIGQESQGHPRVPPLPQGDQGHFQCEYCRRHVCIRNRIQWKIHVFADLQSYVCTHADCEQSLKTFPSREIWADHELRSHFTILQWRCPTCNDIFLSGRDFCNHQWTDHQREIDSLDLSTMASEAEESILKPGYQCHPCVFCLKSDWKSKREYATHVGHHLEEISLASLPMDGGESDEDESKVSTSKDIDISSASDVASYDHFVVDKNKLPRVALGLKDTPPHIREVFRCKEPGCQGQFRRQKHLQRHMKSHSKEKPHVCWVPGCHRPFARSDNLNAHYTKTHSKKGGRNRYVATLDEASEYYDPNFRGQLTLEGLPIYGTEMSESITGRQPLQLNARDD